MDDMLGADRMMKLRREQPLQLRPWASPRDEKRFIRKIRPNESSDFGQADGAEGKIR